MMTWEDLDRRRALLAAEQERLAVVRADLNRRDVELLNGQAILLIAALALIVTAAPIAALVTWWLG